jgi:hypothetical protein
MDETLRKAKRYGARVRRSGGRWTCALMRGAGLACGWGDSPGEAIQAALKNAGGCDVRSRAPEASGVPGARHRPGQPPLGA